MSTCRQSHVYLGGLRCLLNELMSHKSDCNRMMKEYNQMEWKYWLLPKKIGTFSTHFMLSLQIILFSINHSFSFKFGRRHFPLRHSYMMIINKSQDQTLNRIKTVLPEPYFEHNRFYLISPMWFSFWWQEQDRNENHYLRHITKKR